MQENVANELLDDFEALCEERERQKMRGLNDYSLIGSMLKVSDEVRLHSRFLHSFLDPKGRHYQGSLFLRLFLETVGLYGFLDLPGARVYKEFSADGLDGQIDLVITDGERWILIENKINALDQHQQIFRYVSYLVGQGLEPNSICMVYLNKAGAKPSAGSLHQYGISEDERWLVKKGASERIARYLSITYTDHINAWLCRCLAEVGNIGNLSNAIAEYELVRKKLCKEYRSKLMSIEDILSKDSQDIDRERYRAAVNLSSELNRLQAQWVDDAMKIGFPEFLESMGLDAFRLNDKNCQDLKGRIYSSGDAKKFFDPAEGVKNKGAFYGVEIAGSHWAVALLFGSALLHVGVIPLKKANQANKNNSHCFGFDDERTRLIVDDIKRVVESDIDIHGAINSRFPGLISYAQPLRGDGALELRVFESSKFAEVIRVLIELLAQSGNGGAAEGD